MNEEEIQKKKEVIVSLLNEVEEDENRTLEVIIKMLMRERYQKLNK